MINITDFLDTIIKTEMPLPEPSVKRPLESKLKPSTKSIPESKITQHQKSADSLNKKSTLNKFYYQKNKIKIQNQKSQSKKVVLKEELKQFLEQLETNILVSDNNELFITKGGKRFKFTYTLKFQK